MTVHREWAQICSLTIVPTVDADAREELAQLNADRVLAQRLAVETGGEPDPAPRTATYVQQVVAPQLVTRITAPEAPA
ncbi:hypothetical protein AZE42_12702 [Rhizopogon vesiculosus]|uniref:Uncharacterized protein n=1 Tax=Rhizopogon vesiculosus TaxID=180088 RepID=A0A1J8PJT3_9AGAM|nr:hypothetical protein AZE42_12702 [Rhizopogon vesiculosus]